MKLPTLSDTLLLTGFGALCLGCLLVATWLSLVVGGLLVMWYAWKYEEAKAFKNKRGNE